MPEAEFRTIEPKILYFGTPVALISSLNEDGTTNLAPMSSFWALGWTLMLGLLDETKTAENMERHRECVVNLPAPDLWRKVEILAPLTGKDPVPQIKSSSSASRRTSSQFPDLPRSEVRWCSQRGRGNARCTWKRASLRCIGWRVRD